MMHFTLKYTALFALLISFSVSAMAQKAEREYIRKGNKLYRDSAFVDAEVNYRKALEANPHSPKALYNLGNALLFQMKGQEAMKEYELASKLEKDKANQAKIYHNAGVILQSAQEYAKAIEAYKESLRRNPSDDETRYNLALCQKLLKDNEQQNQNNDQSEQEQQQEQQQNTQQQEQLEQQQSDPNKMSQDNAEQLLKSVLQDEKQVQDKVKKKQSMSGNRLQKDW